MFETKAHHVYGLVDPRCKTLFYIGKGVGQRSDAHVITAEKTEEVSNKLNRIRDIHAEGQVLQVIYLAKGYKTDAEAKAIETLLIQIGRQAKKVLGIQCDLTNKQPGNHPEDVRPYNMPHVNDFFDIEDPTGLKNMRSDLFDRVQSEFDVFELETSKKNKNFRSKVFENEFEFRIYIPADTSIIFEYMFCSPKNSTLEHKRHAKEVSCLIGTNYSETDAKAHRRSNAHHVSHNDDIVEDFNVFLEEVRSAVPELLFNKD